MEIKKIVFASGNPDKLIEVKKVLDVEGLELIGTRDLGIDKYEVDEDGDTLHENAFKKAFELYKRIKMPVFSDDTGLFVPYLNGAPGVHSARYSGDGGTYASNRAKLLEEMKLAKGEERAAYFMTVIAFYDGEKEHYFEGRIDGHILEDERGERGFGYDALFLPEGYNLSFAELELDEKNKISHRARSLMKFKEYLTTL